MRLDEDLPLDVLNVGEDLVQAEDDLDLLALTAVGDISVRWRSGVPEGLR